MKDFKFRCLHTLLFFSIILLAACKGGGEARPGPDPEPEPVSPQPAAKYPDIDWPLSPQQVRSFFSGSALNLSSDEIEVFFRDVLDIANTLLVSGLIESPPRGSGSYYRTICDGDSCEIITAPDMDNVTLTLAEFVDSELSETRSVMTYQNVPLVQGRARQNVDGVIIETLSYGGWQDYSVFSAEVAFTPGIDNFDQMFTQSYSIGSTSNINPTSGSGTWRGVMVGTEADRAEDGRRMHRFLQGDAEFNLFFEFYDLKTELSFTNIRYLDTGNFLDDMSWTYLRVEDGRFRDGVSDWGGGMVDGYFYGPDHEEAGGIFRRNSIVGAFGLERVPGPSVFPRFPEISWPVSCRECELDYKEGAEVLDLTSAEIREIYDDLGALVESPAVLDDYLPFINDAEPQTIWTYRGINFAQWRYGDEDGDGGTLIGYGAWLEYSFFGVEVDNLDGDSSGVIPKTYSFGDAAGSNPTAEGGGGTWTGYMVGFYEDQPYPIEHAPDVRGDAVITISDFLNPAVDVTFTNIGRSGYIGFSLVEKDITWASIPLTDGSFKTVDDLGELEGRFYGPNHEEVGGTFIFENHEYETHADKVYGAFGASRNE